MKFEQNPAVKSTMDSFPKEVIERLSYLRKLILVVAEEIGVEELEETLKWGEVSFITPKGSTIRIGWSPKKEEQYGMYFNYQSQLIPTFKVVFGDTFHFEKNRAILFNINDDIPEAELRQCIEKALVYHEIKKKALLGFQGV